MADVKIGFHADNTGNKQGIGDHFERLAQAGKPICLTAADDMGLAIEASTIAKKYDAPSAIAYRIVKGSVPNYYVDPQDAAQSRYSEVIAVLNATTQFWDHADNIWVIHTNEPRTKPDPVKPNWNNMHPVDWLGEFSYHLANMLINDGVKSLAFGMAAGTPEMTDWSQTGMLNYLTLCEDQPDFCGVALHEGFLDGFRDSDGNLISYKTNSPSDLYPFLIGRFTWLFEVCDLYSIDRPPTFITEWSWKYNDIPTIEKAMSDITWVAELIAQYPAVKSTTLWALNGGSQWGNVDDKLQKLIVPLTDYSVTTTLPDPEPEPDPDPEPGCSPRVQYKRIYWVYHPSATDTQRKAIYDLAAEEQITCGPSFDDAGFGALGLDSNTAVLWGIPKEEEVAFTSFFAEYYPGTIVEFRPFPGTEPTVFEFEVYPVDAAPYRTQRWGENPENYEEYGLLGHDGTDLRAARGTRIFAVTDGTVVYVENNPDVHNYGIHVRINHILSYQTIYAHLERADVQIGDVVKAGQVIGLADNTGNSRGSHLHLGLKRLGFVYTDELGTHPFNLFNPDPFLDKFFIDEPEPPSPPRLVRFGLHASTTPTISDDEFGMFKNLKPDIIKVMLAQHPQPMIARMVNEHPQAQFLARIFYSFGGRDRTPIDVYNDTVVEMQNIIPVLAQRDYLIEILNEPNLVAEGLNASWGSGAEFNDWYLTLLALYRQQFPDTRFIFPGLSPGASIPGVRESSSQFMTACRSAINASDGLGVHAYFAPQAAWSVSGALLEVATVQKQFPDKPIWVTESSNNQAGSSPENTAQQIVDFWQGLRTLSRVEGVTYFVASAPDKVWNWGEGGTGQTWLPVRMDELVLALK